MPLPFRQHAGIVCIHIIVSNVSKINESIEQKPVRAGLCAAAGKAAVVIDAPMIIGANTITTTIALRADFFAKETRALFVLLDKTRKD